MAGPRSNDPHERSSGYHPIGILVYSVGDLELGFCVYDVFNQLGSGFLESVYEASVEVDLLAAGLRVKRQEEIRVFFRNNCVGKFIADMVVNELVAVEMKAVRAITPAHEAQLINVLKATSLEVGLILNFGPKPEFKRLIYSNSNKPFNRIVEPVK